jgi:hypothetical protein
LRWPAAFARGLEPGHLGIRQGLSVWSDSAAAVMAISSSGVGIMVPDLSVGILLHIFLAVDLILGRANHGIAR